MEAAEVAAFSPVGPRWPPLARPPDSCGSRGGGRRGEGGRVSDPVQEGNKSSGQLQAELINACFLTVWEELSVLFPGPPALPEVLCLKSMLQGQPGAYEHQGPRRDSGPEYLGQSLPRPLVHPSSHPSYKGCQLWGKILVFPGSFFERISGPSECQFAGKDVSTLSITVIPSS